MSRMLKACFLVLFLCYGGMHAQVIRVERMTVYPKQYATQYVAGTLRMPADRDRGLCVYQFVMTRPQTGNVSLELEYQCSEHARMNLGISFRTRSGGNGSAGKLDFPLPQRRERGTSVISFDMPKTAVSMQVIVGLSGRNAWMTLSSLRVHQYSDSIRLLPVTPSGAPSEWSSAGLLERFYISGGGGLATVQTAVRLTYDDTHLHVGFIAEEPSMAHILSSVTQRDGPVWRDDTVELFLFDASREQGWQFIMNPSGTQFDASLRQAQAGDPYKSDKTWNGEWVGEVFKEDSRWQASFRIPWKTLGFTAAPEKLSMNFARERTGNRENSHWNAYIGNFNDVPRFATVDFGSVSGKITRYRKAEVISYLPKRHRVFGDELLSSAPGHYVVGAWTQGSYAGDYPVGMRQSFTPARQRQFLKERAAAGMFGPLLPWASKPSNIVGGLSELKRQHREFGSRFPYAIFGSGIHARALRRHHGQYFYGKHCDPGSEAYCLAALDELDRLGEFLSQPGHRELVPFIHGIDEPTNMVGPIFSMSRNPGLGSVLSRLDSEIRQKTGFGRYGLYDGYVKGDSETPFRRIAFWRWWNLRFSEYLRRTTFRVRALAHDLPYLAVNRNTCSGLCELDVALLSPHAELLGCDPYPTSTRSFYGMARALYHTGFSVRLLHDLALASQTVVMPQGFVYHGGRPRPDDMREWASQALKNGATWFYWYTGGPAILTMPDGYAEMLRLNRQLSSMCRLPLPKETRSAILYSDYDRWGLNDKAGHSVYSVYSILGECLGANFRFVSPTGLASGLHHLDGIKILYVPRMRYTDSATTKRLMAYMESGGTLMVFDPTFWLAHVDGRPVVERQRLIGELRKRRSASSVLHYGKKRLEVTPVSHIAGESGTVQSYDFVSKSGKVLVTYADGCAAAIEVPVGRGRLVMFGVQPFGNSDLAISPGDWLSFFRDCCEGVGERCDLPVWSYVLPKVSLKD